MQVKTTKEHQRIINRPFVKEFNSRIQGSAKNIS